MLFIMRGVEKYSSKAKSDHWPSDYLTRVDIAGRHMGNTLPFVPLYLTGSVRTWLNGISHNTMHDLDRRGLHPTAQEVHMTSTIAS